MESRSDPTQTGSASASRGGCVVVTDGRPCAAPIESDAPIDLCSQHLLVAFDWVSRETGVTDVLPAPCLACGSRLGVKYPSGWLCAVCEWRVGEIPDAGWGDVRVDVVYYIRFKDRIKIGTSANPRQRLASLPYDELLAFERGDRMLEQRRHAQFATHRIPRTEWFELSDALSAHVAALQSGVSDPWLQFGRWRSEAIALAG